MQQNWIFEIFCFNSFFYYYHYSFLYSSKSIGLFYTITCVIWPKICKDKC